jgi:hypothetical protein
MWAALRVSGTAYGIRVRLLQAATHDSAGRPGAVTHNAALRASGIVATCSIEGPATQTALRRVRKIFRNVGSRSCRVMLETRNQASTGVTEICSM